MTIGEQLEIRQPQIYNFLIELFDLNMRKTARVNLNESEILKEFGVSKELYDSVEESAEFKYYRDMMEKPRGVKQ